jgi:hypothetical protein
MTTEEMVAREFHKAYETLAPHFGYKTRQDSAVPWEEVPEVNRNLMMAVITELLSKGVITVNAEFIGKTLSGLNTATDS